MSEIAELSIHNVTKLEAKSKDFPADRAGDAFRTYDLEVHTKDGHQLTLKLYANPPAYDEIEKVWPDPAEMERMREIRKIVGEN